MAWKGHGKGTPSVGEDEKNRPLEEHLKDFESVLRSRGRCEAHVKDRVGCLAEWVTETKAVALRDLDAARIARWLSSLDAVRMVAPLQKFGDERGTSLQTSKKAGDCEQGVE